VHTLTFLAPEHFHAALTLRECHPLVRDEIFVYGTDDGEIREFLELVARFNARPERPTRWRPVVRVGGDPLARLLAERAGEVAIVAGRNDRKMGRVRQLHDAGLAVLADKPWLTGSDGLADLREVLAGPPLAMEIMTGRHEVTTIAARFLVSMPAVFGAFVAAGDGEVGVTLEGVHFLEKRVNDAPLRRPSWYFDVRAQGDGLADIPTHLVDFAQQIVSAHAGKNAARPGPPLQILSVRCWPTRVPRPLFARVTGEADFPPALRDLVDGDDLSYLSNAELDFTVDDVRVHASTRWDLTAPAGGGDTHRARLRGTRADIHVEQSADTGWRRRLRVVPRPGTTSVEAALRHWVERAQLALPGVALDTAGSGWEVVIPPALRTGHESHFPLVLDEFIGHVERGVWPASRAASTRNKYELLAQARALAERPGRGRA
jgi:hypothetical protein